MNAPLQNYLYYLSFTIYVTFPAAWFKRMLREMGREDVTVSKLCGNNSNKDTVMEGFGSGRSGNTAQVHSEYCTRAKLIRHKCTVNIAQVHC